MDMTNMFLINRGLPTRGSQATEIEGRATPYGDLSTMNLVPTKHALADEGSYFLASNPTPGTGIAMTISTAFADTVAMFALKNTENAGNPSAKRIYLDYLRLILGGTPPTAVVARHFLFKRSAATDREPATIANRTLLTPVNMANASGRVSICRPLSYSAAAAMTVPAASNGDPMVGRCVIPSSLGILHDEYVVQFGAVDVSGMSGLTAVRATAAARIVTNAPPIIIEPGEWLVIHEWAPTEATNGPTFEFELGWWER